MRALLKDCLHAVTPTPLLQAWRRRKLAVLRARNIGRDVRDIFREIYFENRWGAGQASGFNSGSGSTPTHARLYARKVREFIRDHGIRRVVDLGCGDFQVGAQLISADIEYVGVDIVEELIQHNRRAYGRDGVRFETLDIIQVRLLPEGDLCLIRQVLQHLSNEQIQAVLRNVRGYRYVLVTEHFPAPEAFVAANVDKPCGEDVRIYDGSAVYLDEPPFNQVLRGPILDVDAGTCLVRTGERIRTYLLENASPVTELAGSAA